MTDRTRLSPRRLFTAAERLRAVTENLAALPREPDQDARALYVAEAAGALAGMLRALMGREDAAALVAAAQRIREGRLTGGDVGNIVSEIPDP